MPTTARMAWTAGMAEQAWERFADDKNPWTVVARLELASLAGNAGLMRALLRRAGPLGAPAAAALLLPRCRAARKNPVSCGRARRATCGVRTHIGGSLGSDAARQVARVEVYDLAANELPDEQVLPKGALDDSSLLGMVDPLPVATRPVKGTGVWIDTSLCDGVGIGHDWPREETAELAREVGR